MFHPTPRRAIRHALTRRAARRAARDLDTTATALASVATGITIAESVAAVAAVLTGWEVPAVTVAVVAGTAASLALLAASVWHTVEAARVREGAGCARFTRRVFYTGTLAVQVDE